MIEITDLQMKYNLSPSLAKLLRLLIENKIVTGRMVEIEHKLSTDARIAMHRLRRRMDGTEIEIKSRRDVGYWLDPDHKDEIIREIGLQLRLPLDHEAAA